MNLFKDGLSYLYQCVSEVDFGDVIVKWWNYRYNVPAIKQLGGMYATVIYDSKTGKFLSKQHYKSDYMRAHCMPKLIDDIKASMLKDETA